MPSFVLIDESGTLPDPQDRCIVLAAVVIRDLSMAEDILRRFRPNTHPRERIREIKFYHLGPKSKTRLLKSFRDFEYDIFILIVDKKGRIIRDNPQNMASLCSILVHSFVPFCKDLDMIVFDRHFTRKIDLRRFDDYLRKTTNTNTQIEHRDSQSFPLLGIADMIAGATLAKTRGDMQYYELFREKIVSEVKISWPEAKSRMFPKKIA